MASHKLPVTLRIVAEESGFSVNTVAKVLAGQAKQARISDRSARKIKRVATRLGYVPNQLARSLRANRSGLVGVFVAEMTDPVYAAIAHSILEKIPQRGLFPVLAVAEAGYDLCYETWIRNRIDGLILCGTVAEMAENMFDLLNEAGIATVVAGCRYERNGSIAENFDVSSVQINNRAGMRLCIDHLRSRGRRQIAFLAGPQTHSDANERKRAYTEIMKRSHEPIIVEAIENPEHLTIGYEATGTLLREHGKTVDAIIGYDDMIAIGALKCLWDKGLHVPRDVAVMGFDNVPHGQYSIPMLSTVSQPTDEIGLVAVDLLVSNLKLNAPAKHVLVEPSLVIREST